MRELKTMEYACGLIAVIVGLGFYSYNSYSVRELLASLILFTMGFFLLGVATLGVFLIWFASDTVAVRTVPASRKLVALSRHFLVAYTKHRDATGAISKCNF